MGTGRKQLAIELRKSGLSIKAIAHQLGAAQSSVSIWTREVILTELQISILQAKTHAPDVIEKRRQSRLQSELAKRNAAIQLSAGEVRHLTLRELWLIGAGLYWAEGRKTQSVVQFSNSDPRMVEVMMRFFREICNVDESKIRCGIHIHEHLDSIAAEKFWQSVTYIPENQFYKTYNKPNKSSKGIHKNRLPYGVCDVYVLDAKLLLRLKGWAQGIYDSTLEML